MIIRYTAIFDTMTVVRYDHIPIYHCLSVSNPTWINKYSRLVDRLRVCVAFNKIKIDFTVMVLSTHNLNKIKLIENFFII